MFGAPLLADFALDPEKVHLNHGSHGAVPACVRRAQREWRDRIERSPTSFFRRDAYQGLLRDAAEALAAEFGGKGRDWVFVENATVAANAVVAGLDLGPGDEILTSSEVYNAVRQALRHYGGGRGARVIEVPLDPPVPGDDFVVEAFERHMGPRTRALFVDHITSRSGLILPVERIAALCRKAGIPIFVDGAHAPAMIDLDVPGLDVTWYAGNGHKWLSAPLGCGFLWCAPDRQATTHPLVISHGYGQGYNDEFDWVGTRDPSGWLSLPAALDYHRALGGPVLRRRNRELALAMGERLCTALDGELAGPPAMMGSMAAVPLPDGGSAGSADPQALVDLLDRDWNIVVAANDIGGRPWLRVSAAPYNDLADCEALIGVLDRLGFTGFLKQKEPPALPGAPSVLARLGCLRRPSGARRWARPRTAAACVKRHWRNSAFLPADRSGSVHPHGGRKAR